MVTVGTVGARGVKPLSWLGAANGILLAVCGLMLVVRLASPDPDLQHFPRACPEGLPIGCSRVAFSNPQQDGGKAPLLIESLADAVNSEITAWVTRRGGHVLAVSETGGNAFFHFRFLSLVMGFADDFMVSVTCNHEV